jgi:hypothetical protein
MSGPAQERRRPETDDVRLPQVRCSTEEQDAEGLSIAPHDGVKVKGEWLWSIS